MFRTMTMESSQHLRVGHAVSRWAWLLVALVCFAAVAPRAAEAGPASVQMRVSATVMPRCQEWNAATGLHTTSTRSCAPGAVTLVRQAEDLSVRSAPGSIPQVTRQAGQTGRSEIVVVVF